MTTQPTQQHDKQFMRQVFDTIYGIDPTAPKRWYKNLSTRAKWNLFTAITCVVLVFIGMQLVQGGVTLYQEANAPTINDYLMAPYDLSESTLQIDTAILPDLAGYTQTPIELANINPIIACMDNVANCPELAEGEEPLGIILQSGIASEYVDGQNRSIRVTALAFVDNTTAQDALEALFTYRRNTGRIGNYVTAASQPVRYFYATSSGQVHFTWSMENGVYTISTNSWRNVESMLDLLRTTAPPMPTDGQVSG